MEPAGDWDLTKTDLLDEDTQIRPAFGPGAPASQEEVRVYYRGPAPGSHAVLAFDGGTEIAVSDRLRIGRNFFNEVVIWGDKFVSRLHAEIRVSGDVVSIVDLGSRNGTYVNGRPIPRRKPIPLSPDDRILFGGHVEATFRPNPLSTE